MATSSNVTQTSEDNKDISLTIDGIINKFKLHLTLPLLSSYIQMNIDELNNLSQEQLEKRILQLEEEYTSKQARNQPVLSAHSNQSDINSQQLLLLIQRQNNMFMEFMQSITQHKNNNSIIFQNNMTIEKFKGKDFKTWFNNFNSYLITNKIDVSLKIHHLRLHLLPDDQIFLDDLLNDDLNYEQIIESFTSRYHDTLSIKRASKQLIDISRKGTINEKEIDDIIKNVSECIRIIHKRNTADEKLDIIKSYVDALLPTPIQRIINNSTTHQKDKKYKYCSYHKTNGHSTDECRKIKKNQDISTNRYTGIKNTEQETSISNNHNTKNTRSFTRITAAKPGSVLFNINLTNISNKNLHVKDITAYLDGGCDVCLISDNLATQLQLKTKSTSIKLFTGNNKEFPPIGEAQILISIGDIKYKTTTYIVQTSILRNVCYAEFIVGNDLLLYAKQYSVNYETSTITLGNTITVPIIEVCNDKHISVSNQSFLRVVQNVDTELDSVIKKQFSSVFSSHSKDIGTMPFTLSKLPIKPDIELPKIKKYHYNPNVQHQINSLTDELYKLGILEPANNPLYISNFVLAGTAKSNEKRICGDFRSLNSIICKEATYLPRYHDTIYKLNNATVYFAVDFTKSFWTIPLDSSIRPYFSMFTNYGIRQFTRMPFGYLNATAVFNKALNNLLQPIIEKYSSSDTGIILYVDDLVGYSDSTKKLNNLMTDILTLFQSNNIKLSLSKSHFFCDTITFLSFTIHKGTIRPSEGIITRIIQFSPPSNLKQLRRWLAMVGYVSNHIKDLNIILKPISHLLKKGIPFHFSDTCLEIFNHINRLLESRPILQIPDWDKDFYLEVDSSSDATGAVLLQKVNGDLLPIQYFSKRHAIRKRPIKATFLELNGILQALRHWKDFLSTSTVHLMTDHKPLLGLLRDGRTPELNRILDFITQFDIKLSYKRGESMVISDTLSRMFLRITSTPDNITPTKPPNYKQLLENFHKQMSHLGYRKTIPLLKDKINYTGIEKDFFEITKSCNECQRINLHLSSHAEKKIIVKHPMEIITMDLLGPVYDSPDGFRYILSIVDSYSRFTILSPARTTAGVEIADLFKNNFIYVFGPPHSIRVDNATSFDNQHFRQLSQQFGFRLDYGIPYYSKSQSIVERSLRTVNMCISKLKLQFPDDDWTTHLNSIQLSMNLSIHSTFDISPYELFLALPPLKLSNLSHAQRLILRTLEENYIVSTLTTNDRSIVQPNDSSDLKTGDLIYVQLKQGNKWLPRYSDLKQITAIVKNRIHFKDFSPTTEPTKTKRGRKRHCITHRSRVKKHVSSS
uniref:RNA-directed DNA polymerase n=1 Tax=Strongyloides stercoralis TaxID=6248 RepID=A0A0K0ERQ5_STRER